MYRISGDVGGETVTVLAHMAPDATREALKIIKLGANVVVITREGEVMKRVTANSYGRDRGTIVSIETVRDARRRRHP
jgi:Tfp pilus assembly protein PilX